MQPKNFIQIIWVVGVNNVLCISLYLADMLKKKMKTLEVRRYSLTSLSLERDVLVDCFSPTGIANTGEISLLLINDGQNMQELGLENMLHQLMDAHQITPVFCVAIHAGAERKMEYGTAGVLDYQGLGAKATAYTQFIFEELIPFVRSTYAIPSFRDKSFAGFSLGGLSALDIVWHHPREFSRVGVFSGSLWWRTKSLEEDYNEDTDRIMHAQVKKGGFYPWLKFFFETGVLDETMDRNNNGIIDSIDDTLGLIEDLCAHGYRREQDIQYLELADGKHDVATWARAMPVFLKWGWGTGVKNS